LRRAGRAPSRLAGIPISVKDLFDLAGEVTRAGSRVLEGASPAAADAPAIARLKAAGLIVIGRTNMTEFAYSGVGLNPHYGTPRSPYDRATGRIPGGSSSGAAVSVADGVVSLAIGSDTGGSCRIPASYCGITGFKPSHGRIPLTGAYPLSFSFDSIGSLSRSVAGCAMADALMAGDWTGEIAQRPVRGLRLAVLKDYVLEGLEAPVAAAFERTLKTLAGTGAVLADVSLPALAALPEINARGGIVAAEALQQHRVLIGARGGEYDPRVRNRILVAEAISAADYLDIARSRLAMIADFERSCAGFDAVIMPTTLNTPPAIAELAAERDYLRCNAMSLRNTYVANFLNGCAVSIPMEEKGAAPCGFMLMRPWGGDRALFAVAAAVEGLVRQR
jgi:aspartyl-tRNA(Asn)/glutamyl-tRNA(Gln) amidotransferase subunit A